MLRISCLFFMNYGPPFPLYETLLTFHISLFTISVYYNIYGRQ